MKIERHRTKKWIVSIYEYNKKEKSFFKVTRRIPELSVSETRIFNSKEEAEKQFYEWLN